MAFRAHAAVNRQSFPSCKRNFARTCRQTPPLCRNSRSPRLCSCPGVIEVFLGEGLHVPEQLIGSLHERDHLVVLKLLGGLSPLGVATDFLATDV